MLRVRKRLFLTLSGAFLLLFLVIYFVINSAAPVEDKPNFGYIKNKLQQLENGLQKHGKEMVQLKSQLETNFKQHWNLAKADEYKQKHVSHDKVVSPQKMQRKHNVGVEMECTLDIQEVPENEIQMLDLYINNSFADIDGGAWKQGWHVKYDPLRYNKHHKLKVFVVPHSHNDPGWIKTFDDYYEHDTKHILSNALRHLHENPEMRFIWAEISYFSRFYDDLGEQNKLDMKKLVHNGQLEFVTGGWVMTDEANSHWMSILMQLTEGQAWLKNNFNVTPSSSWSIDPFGHSPTLPYILQKSGFKNLLIQRTHYSVKKALAEKRQLEFYWRQLWDTKGSTELFTHMMPFYSYDIPHTCGPDPKICCQFDFKRIHGFGLTCPWRVQPQVIDDRNVKQRAEMIIDQWKKKAELYRTKALLIPLGDDFRYSQSTEWDVQRMNYNALFDYINSHPQYFVEAKFGTLQEYFNEAHKEKESNGQLSFPTLSGDFFTYADRADNYWSGYFTSRPYHKRMDRVLLHYLRSAEMLHAWHSWDPNAKFDEMLQNARRDLSLFQHHDGITGTAKTHVMHDYMKKMLDAIKSCKFVMQQSVYRLLTKPTIYNADYRFNYFYLDDSRWPGPDDSRPTIILGQELPQKHVVFHNSLPQWREEIVDFYVSTPFVSVMDFNNNPVKAQVTPVFTWHRQALSSTFLPQAATTKYRLLFKVSVPPMGLITYIIQMEPSEPNDTTYAECLILTDSPLSITMGDYPYEVKFSEHRELSLHVEGSPTVAFTTDGLMKSIQLDEASPHVPVHLKFMKYGTRVVGDRSGAYLFIPNGPATPIMNMNPPVVLVVEGSLESSVTVGLPFVVHQTLLRAGAAPEIRNLVDITEMEDTEITMRISTHIESGDIFYTDLNGLQMIKRKRFVKKIPIQGNFYPVPSAIYIEDNMVRLTVTSAQPLGGSSLESGELEIIQDRRLTHDDERGLGQGVLDNQPVLQIFRIVLEKLIGCNKPVENYPMGALTVSAYRNSKAILHPIDKFIFAENDWLGVLPNFGNSHEAVADDMEVILMRDLGETIDRKPVARDRTAHSHHNIGIVVHRTHLLTCQDTNMEYHSGHFNFKNLLQMSSNVTAIHSSTLTFLQQLENVDTDADWTLCPMDTKAYILQRRS